MAVTTNFSFTLTDFDKIPWHTEEHNNWHEVDALLARYLAVSNVKGVWQNALTVAVDERYIDPSDDTIWEVLIAHTTSSTLTFSAERAAKPTYWQSISVDASYAGDWAAGESYTVNQFISDSKRYGVVTVAHTSVTSYNQGVSDGNITTLIDASELVSTSPVATTLSAGSSATVTYNSTTGVFTFGLPTGATGDTGATGSVESTLSTRGDIIVRNASNVTARLAVGSANTVLKSDGSDVSYGTIATANIASDAVTGAKIADDSIDSEHYVDGSIDTAHIADDQITEAKIANDAVGLAELKAGTDGELITWDASGNPVAVGAGTSGHFLKSQGAGSVPVFAAAGGGMGSFVGTQNITVAQAATEVGGFDSSSDLWQWEITDMDNSALAEMYFYFSNDGGSSFETSSYAYTNRVAGGTAWTATESAGGESEITLTNASSGRPGPEAKAGVSLSVRIYNPSNASVQTHISWSGVGGNDDNAQPTFYAGSAWREVTEVTTDLKFAFSTGSHTGRFTLYKWALS